MLNLSPEKTYALFETPFNKKIIADLALQQINTVIFPTITTREYGNGNLSLDGLAQFDWLIFPDVYTVEYFVSALEKIDFDLFELDSIRVLAFGEAVSDRLRFSQLHGDVIPASIKAYDVIAALKDYVYDDFSELKFLLLREQASDLAIVSELKNLGSNVSELPIYSAKIDDETQIPKLKSLLKGGAIDEFIFSTHFDVLNLAQIFQSENLDEILEGITLTATDGLTLQSLKEFRLS